MLTHHEIRTPSPAAEAALVHSASSSFDVVSTSSHAQHVEASDVAEQQRTPSSTPWSRVSSHPDLDIVTTPGGASATASCVDDAATPRSDGTAPVGGALTVVPQPVPSAVAPSLHIRGGIAVPGAPEILVGTGRSEVHTAVARVRGVLAAAQPTPVLAATTARGPFGLGHRRGPAAGNGQCPWVNWQCQAAELQSRSRHIALRRNAAPALLTTAAEKRRGKPSPAQLRGAKSQHYQQHHHYHHHTEQRKSFHPNSDVKTARTKAPAAAPIRRRK
jgi:hypothetical protein